MKKVKKETRIKCQKCGGAMSGGGSVCRSCSTKKR